MIANARPIVKVAQTELRMITEIGHVEAIYGYPVKSMAGELLESASLGWSGFDGDRRLAFRRLDNRSAFPWLSATRVPELLQFSPCRREEDGQEEIPTYVRTPDGQVLEVFGEELAARVESRYGAPVQMMQLKHGIFDEASISVIATATVSEICGLAGQRPDVRRFRPNIVVRALHPSPFLEDRWVGGVLTFGEEDNAPAVAVTMRDIRCGMVNLDPDSAASAPEMLKTIVRENQTTAGVYATVTRMGRIIVGQRILLDKNSAPDSCLLTPDS